MNCVDVIMVNGKENGPNRGMEDSFPTVLCLCSIFCCCEKIIWSRMSLHTDTNSSDFMKMNIRGELCVHVAVFI